MRRPWVPLLLTFAVSSCCKAPKDPDDPGASGPAKSARRLLDAIRAGEDDEAWAMTGDFYRFERTREQFSERLDGFADLREFDEVEFTKVHYRNDEDHDEQPLFERCLGRAVQNVEVEATLVDDAGHETSVHLDAHRMGTKWGWKGIQIDGKRLMPERPVPKNPNWKPPAPASPPPPAPKATPPKFAPPPPPSDPIDGRWAIREYAVDLDPPSKAWLLRYDAMFGLELGLGAPRRLGIADSTIALRTNCEGMCRPETFDERVETTLGERVLGNMAREVGASSWVQQPTKLGDGAWWMHVRGEEAGKTVRQRVLYAWMDPKSDRGWLQCEVETTGEQLERIDELRKWCADLKWTYAGDPTEPVETRFEETYALDGREVSIPTPAGFSFSLYDPLRSAVEFKGIDNILDAYQIHTGCAGTCASEHLRANLEKGFGERVGQLKSDDEEPKVEVPLELREGLFVSRIRTKTFDAPAVELQVVAIPEGASRFVKCEVRLHGDAVDRADELEAACRRSLAPLVG